RFDNSRQITCTPNQSGTPTPLRLECVAGQAYKSIPIILDVASSKLEDRQPALPAFTEPRRRRIAVACSRTENCESPLRLFIAGDVGAHNRCHIDWLPGTTLTTCRQRSGNTTRIFIRQGKLMKIDLIERGWINIDAALKHTCSVTDLTNPADAF